MKRITTLLLALFALLSLSMASCGSDDDETKTAEAGGAVVGNDGSGGALRELLEKAGEENSSVVGTWEAEKDVSDFVAAALEKKTGVQVDQIDKLILPVTWEFNKNGAYNASADMKVLESNYTVFSISLKWGLMEAIKKSIEEEAAANGESYDQLLRFYENALWGRSLQDYVNKVVGVDMSFDAMFGNLDTVYVGKYTASENTIILDGMYALTFKLNSGTLTLDTDEDLGDVTDLISFPLTLKRA